MTATATLNGTVGTQPVLCQSCACMGKTCCQKTDIYVTLGDVRRIFVRTGLHDIYEYRKSSQNSYDDQTDDPIWAMLVFRPDGTRRVLKRDPQDNCSFLTPTGCSLALDVRPLICRLHPHLYDARGIYRETISEDCPLYLLASGQSPAEAIPGFGGADAHHWHRMLYSELIWEIPYDENRADL
jgi:Fe-S-cluster containining protein